MKFKNYILNEGRTKKISEDEIINLINTKCKNNYNFLRKSSLKIYRGVNFLKNDYGFVDSNKGKARISANTLNYFTLLMDNLPSWKDYPKRSRSIICSTDINISKYYGDIYYVIPFDNINIGIATSDDIWGSFKYINKYYTDISEFNYFLYHIFNFYNVKVDQQDYNSLKKGLIELNKNSDELEDNTYKLDIFNKDRDIIKYLDRIFSPTYNKFEKGIKNIKEKREVWIQGKSLLINIEKFPEFPEFYKENINEI